MSDQPLRRFAGCPHKDIRDCPLYQAAHSARYAGFSCAGVIEPDGCDADYSWPYEKGLARLQAAHPELVAHVEWLAQQRHSTDQRSRNMRALGLH